MVWVKNVLCREISKWAVCRARTQFCRPFSAATFHHGEIFNLRGLQTKSKQKWRVIGGWGVSQKVTKRDWGGQSAKKQSKVMRERVSQKVTKSSREEVSQNTAKVRRLEGFSIFALSALCRCAVHSTISSWVKAAPLLCSLASCHSGGAPVDYRWQHIFATKYFELF